jgi:hypothetical protein
MSRSWRGSQSGFPLLTPNVPFQGFARWSGIQVFTLYSTPPYWQRISTLITLGKPPWEGGLLKTSMVRTVGFRAQFIVNHCSFLGHEGQHISNHEANGGKLLAVCPCV